MDRAAFFKSLRATGLFPNGLTQLQVEGIERLLNRWEYSFPTGDPRWIAYILGTACHETDRTFQPIEEYEKGGSRWYAQPDPENGLRYYGRGYVQITHRDNYKRIGQRVGQDLENHPELALDPVVATEIIVVGMVDGLFTGAKLSWYFRDDKEDWINARRIVNGLDRAELIAGYGKTFLKGIQAGTLLA